jgi:hypothetical protein
MGKADRLRKAMRFEAVDRVPLCGGYIMIDTYLAALAGCSLEQFWRDKEAWAIEAYRKMDMDAVCQLCLPTSPTQFRGGYYLDSDRVNVTSDDILDDYRGLDYDNPLKDLDLDRLEEQWVTRHRRMQALCGDMVWIDGFQAAVGPMMPWWHYLDYGYQAFFMFLMLHEDDVRRYAEYQSIRSHAINERYAQVFRREGWLFVYGGEDMASTDRLFVSPKYLQRNYWPFLRYAMEPLRQEGIDVIWHCDGDLRVVVPWQIACGCTGFQGGQREAGMVFDELASTRVYGGRLPIMFGAMSVTTELPRDYGTVTAAVEHQVDICAARGGGHIVFMTNTAIPGIPLENIVGAYEHAREYSKGKYLGAEAMGVDALGDALPEGHCGCGLAV